MNYRQYETTLNTIRRKAPLESGVQTLVYMFLYEMFENAADDLVVIDRTQKKSRFTTYAGVSDLAVVSKDFDYHNENGSIRFCIEIKEMGKKLDQELYKAQLLGYLLTYQKAIITNGILWRFYSVENASGTDVFCKLQDKAKEATRLTKEYARLSSLRKKNEQQEQQLKQWKKSIEGIKNQINSKKYEDKIGEIMKPKWEYTLGSDNGSGIRIDPSEYMELTEYMYRLIRTL